MHGRHVVATVCPDRGCHVDARVPGRTKKQNRQQGLTVIRFDAGTCRDMSPVAGSEGEALFEGELERAQEPLEELRADTGWEYKC